MSKVVGTNLAFDSNQVHHFFRSMQRTSIRQEKMSSWRAGSNEHKSVQSKLSVNCGVARVASIAPPRKWPRLGVDRIFRPALVLTRFACIWRFTCGKAVEHTDW